MAKQEEKYETLKEILEKIDPMEAAIMILGGTAASNGIVPPMTRLLSVFIGGDLTSNSKFSPDFWQLLTTPGYKLLTTQNFWNTPGWELIYNWINPPAPVQPQTQEQKDVMSAKIGLFCSGAIEAVLMYKLVSNPEALKGIIALPGQVLQGIGDIIPG